MAKADVDLMKPPLVSRNVVIGVCLAIGGNLLISISMNIQKYALTRIQQQNGQPAEQRSRPSYQYLTSSLWWTGIVLMIVGEGGNFLAYGFGPASVVAPLGTTTVVVNAYVSRCLGERLRCQDILGTVIIVIGAFMIIVFSSQNDDQYTASQIVQQLLSLPFVLYITLECFIFLVVLYLRHVRGFNHLVMYLLPAALLGSLTVLGAKACSMLLALAIQGQLYQLGSPVFYIMLFIVVVTGIFQIKYVTAALQEHEASVVVPVFFVFFTLSAILVGVFFYGEFVGVEPVRVFLFIFGCICSFTGVFMITSGREIPNEEDDVIIGDDAAYEDDSPTGSESPLIPPPTSLHLVQPRQKDYPGEIAMLSDSSEGTEIEMQDMSNVLRDNPKWPTLDRAVFNPQVGIDGDTSLNLRRPNKTALQHGADTRTR